MYHFLEHEIQSKLKYFLELPFPNSYMSLLWEGWVFVLAALRICFTKHANQTDPFTSSMRAPVGPVAKTRLNASGARPSGRPCINAGRKWMEDSHFQGILNDCFYRRDLPIMCSVVPAPPLSIYRLATKSHLFRKGSRFLDGILLFSLTGASAIETGLITLTMAASQHT